MNKLTAIVLVALVATMSPLMVAAVAEEEAHPPHIERREAARLASGGCYPAPSSCGKEEDPFYANEPLEDISAYVGAQVQAAQEQWFDSVVMEDHWLRIGRCEQPGSGYGGVDWQGGGPNHVGTFAGGLGIMVQAWDENRPADYPASALDATPHQQMVVATIIYNKHPNAWGCK